MPHELERHAHWCIRAESYRQLVDDVKHERELKVGRVPKVQGNIAVIPVEGPLTPKGGFFSTSMQSVGAAFQSAIQSSKVGAVVLAWDSPGGTAVGTPELADRIYNARGTKPIISVVTPQMASAALWIGSAADQVIVTPSGEAGSHGVFSAHVDYSKAYEEAGIKVSFISAGKYKVEGNPYEPMGEEFAAHEQQEVNAIYDDFTAALSRNYGVPKSTVLSNFGEGRMMSAKNAEAAGLVHGIDTLENVISRLQSKSGGSRGMSVEQLKAQKRKKNRKQSLT